MCPDYTVLCISALTGVTSITRQHLTVALALEIPTIFVITKIDLAQRGAIESIHKEIRSLGKIISNASFTPSLPSTHLVSHFFMIFQLLIDFHRRVIVSD